jgi:hypothetical protein
VGPRLATTVRSKPARTSAWITIDRKENKTGATRGPESAFTLTPQNKAVDEKCWVWSGRRGRFVELCVALTGFADHARGSDLQRFFGGHGDLQGAQTVFPGHSRSAVAQDVVDKVAHFCQVRLAKSRKKVVC